MQRSGLELAQHFQQEAPANLGQLALELRGFDPFRHEHASLGQDVAGIRPVVEEVDGDACFLQAQAEGPEQGRGAAVLRQEGRMDVDGQASQLVNTMGDQPIEAGDDDDVGRELADGGLGGRAPKVSGFEDRQAAFPGELHDVALDIWGEDREAHAAGFRRGRLRPGWAFGAGWNHGSANVHSGGNQALQRWDGKGSGHAEEKDSRAEARLARTLCHT